MPGNRARPHLPDASPGRLRVDGGPTGRVASDLEIPPATLSFHLKELKSARLVTSEREGRVIRYAPDFGVIADVVAYLGENCCRDTGGCGSEAGATEQSGPTARAHGARNDRSARAERSARETRAERARTVRTRSKKGDPR